MTELRIKIEAGYGTTIATSEDQLLCARVLTMIHEIEATAEQNLTPEQVAINALKEELDTVRADLSMVKYSRDNIQKKLDEARGES